MMNAPWTKRVGDLLFPMILILLTASLAGAATKNKAKPYPELPSVTRAMKADLARDGYAGVVTLVASPGRILHLSCVGKADLASGAPMRPNTMGWIASMTKPVTACAILMLQEEGKLSVDDPVANYLPELADVKTTDGVRGNLTLRHLLTHTSGLAEAKPEESKAAHALADLIPCYAKKPLQFKPGTKWVYCQSGINSLGRIVEVVSGQSLPEFFKQRIFTPLGMKDTTFYPNARQQARMAKAYKTEEGKLVETPVLADYDYRNTGRPPLANGGLYSTALDYARFCRMLLNGGTLDSKRILKPETVKRMATICTGELKTGFTPGNGWGLGVCVVRQPQGPTEALAPGSFGHGGAYGTQGWIDPVNERVYVMMIQTTHGGDTSKIRADFQSTAVKALANQ